MAIEIKNNKDGTTAGVTKENQLKTRAEMHALQFHTSFVNGDAYQVIHTDTGITAEDSTVLHIKNTSATKLLAVTYVRVMDLGSVTTHAVGHHFTLGVGDTVASGGDSITPVNVNQGSGKVAEVTVTADPTEGDTFTEIDRVYTVAGEQNVWRKEGSVILSQGDTFSVKRLSTGTGAATVRVSFVMLDKDRED